MPPKVALLKREDKKELEQCYNQRAFQCYEEFLANDPEHFRNYSHSFSILLPVVRKLGEKITKLETQIQEHEVQKDLQLELQLANFKITELENNEARIREEYQQLAHKFNIANQKMENLYRDLKFRDEKIRLLQSK